jgi:hypothetical protein
MSQPGPPNPYAPPTQQQGWGPPAGYPYPQQAPRPQQSNRAQTALLMAAVSFVTCGPLLGIPAMILAKREMSAIERGEANPANLGTAKSAYWIGVVSVVYFLLILISTSIYMYVAFQRGMQR